jgi:MFS family permease
MQWAKAFGVYGAIAGGGAAIGLLLGGVLTEYASWRWCLLVNVPIALLAVAGALMVPGLLLASAGLLLLSRLTPTSSYVTHVLPSMIMMSVGLALVFIPVASTALHAVGGHDAGVASALINTSQQVGGSLGTALLNTVAAASTTTYLVSH